LLLLAKWPAIKLPNAANKSQLAKKIPIESSLPEKDINNSLIKRTCIKMAE
jgi:hypothetical protein